MPYGLQRSVAGLLDAFGEAKPDDDGFTCEATDNVFSNRRCACLTAPPSLWPYKGGRRMS